VRKLLAIAALAACGMSTAAAQSSWTRELGIEGGYAKLKPAGTGASDAINLFDIPGGSFALYSSLGGGSVFAILPWHNKLAIETQLSGTQLNLGGTTVTTARLGLRGDYALSPQFYAAVGGVLHYISGLGTNETMQLGVTAGVGYRRRLTNTINGRLEGNFTATNKKLLGAFDVYAIRLGISSSLGGGKMAAASRRANNRAWDPAIGFSAGYQNMHLVGTGTDVGGLSFPGLGGSLGDLGLPFAPTPTMFVIIPMGQKLALEPGVDFHSYSPPGGPSIKVINLAGRLDYAVGSNWYGAAGGHLVDFSPSGGGGGTTDGVDVAWGYRFHLGGAFGGRLEANYSLTAKSSKLGTPAVNTLSVMFGAMMPLK
jgi:hypothetical protein